MAMISLKVAAPDTEDFDGVYQFNRIMNALTDNRMWRSATEGDWKDWDEDEEDYKILKDIEKEACFLEDETPENVDQRIVLWDICQWIK